jgi:hypothetical protein
VLGCKGVGTRRAPNPRDPMYPHDVWFAFVHDRAFHGVQGIHQSVHITCVRPIIPAGGQRTAGQEANIGVPAANEQDYFARLDAGEFSKAAHSRRKDRLASPDVHPQRTEVAGGLRVGTRLDGKTGTPTESCGRRWSSIPISYSASAGDGRPIVLGGEPRLCCGSMIACMLITGRI